MISDFFAVTLTSLYHVVARDEHGHPFMEKIAMRNPSRVGVGERIDNGTMLAICKFLLMYVPEGGGGYSSFERKVEQVNSRYWGGNTTHIVALFTEREDAMRCLKAKALKPCDPRWIEDTKKVLDAIGDKHPSFEICHQPDLALLSA